MNRPRVLFIVNEVAHYLEFKKILCSEKIASQIDHLILFDREGYDVHELFRKEIQDCQRARFNYFLRSSFPRNNSRVLSYLMNQSSRLTSKLIPGFQFCLNIQNDFSFFKCKIRDLRLLFKRESISAIVLGEENILMDTFLYKKAFNGNPVLVYPYTIPNPKEMAGGAYRISKINSFSGRLLQFFGGQFSKQFNNNIYLLVRPSKIIAMIAMGYFPTNPWILNDDNADIVCLESKKMADLYIKLGVNTSRLAQTGNFNDDLLTKIISNKEHNRAAFIKKYNLPDKPIVLVGFPPDQFPLATAEHKSYQELIASFTSSLLPYLDSFSIIITKHPRMKHSLTSMADVGFILAEEPTVDLIPFSHIYIASASATIRWALAAGVPVINYDMYRYDYGDYDSAAGVVTVSSEETFKKELRQILTNSSYYSDLFQKQKKESHLWGVLDGNVADRFLKLINNLLNKGENNEST